MRTIAQILEAVASSFDVPVAAIRGPSKTRRISHARFAVCWVLRRQRPGLTLSDIGRAVGRTDHSTILHAIDRANVLERTDPDFRQALHEAARLEDDPPPPTDPMARNWPWSTFWATRWRTSPKVSAA